MNNLRNFGIAMLLAVVLLAIVGVIAAVFEYWVLAVALAYGMAIMSVITTLLAARYISRHARTGEQRSKVLTQKLAARVKESMQRDDETHAELVRMIKTTNESIVSTGKATQETLATTHEKLEELQQEQQDQARTGRHHVANTVRDSTRQIESLVHLYTNFPDVKLPMPNTGGFAIDSQALGHLISLVQERQPQRILELGSGTSTIWLGYLCRSFGGKLVTLDHLEKYLELTRTAVERHGLQQEIECRYAPLEATECDGKTFKWYAASAMADLSNIDMVIVDGPPAATGPQARYPALPKIIERLAPNATVVLDDAHRKDEAKIVDSWIEAFPEFQVIERGTSRLAVLERKAS